MTNGSKFRDFTGAVDAFLDKSFKDTEAQRCAGMGAGLTVKEHFELNARTALFMLKQQAQAENSPPLQALIPLIARRMEKMFDIR